MNARDPFAGLINQRAKMAGAMVPINQQQSDSPISKNIRIGKGAAQQMQQPENAGFGNMGAHFMTGMGESAQGIGSAIGEMGTMLPNPMQMMGQFQNITGMESPLHKLVSADIRKHTGAEKPKTWSKEWLAEQAGGLALPLPGIGGGAKVAAPLAKAELGAVAGKVGEYMHPEREAERIAQEAEQFRGTLGQGTAQENIERLGKRVQFAKGSAKQEALMPKHELYAQEGGSHIYNVKPENLPEGNLEKFARMFDDHGHVSIHGFGQADTFGGLPEEKASSLSKALLEYRKSGKVDNFLEKAEDILGVEELPEKAADHIEDTLLMPTERKSSYFKDKDVAEFYGKKSAVKKAHDAYEKNPILNNYDVLQSKLKKEVRQLERSAKNNPLVGDAATKYDQLVENVKNLNKDKERFMKTIPEKMQNLENEFRTKYQQGVGKYEDAGDKARNVIRKLAKGKHQEVTPADIGRVFSHPTEEVNRILKDLGPSASKEVLYNALMKVPEGDASKLAKTILDLKRTKGYDNFVTPEIENWANSTLRRLENVEARTGRVEKIKKFMSAGAGALGGGAMFGPLGAIAGAAYPLRSEIKHIASRMRK